MTNMTWIQRMDRGRVRGFLIRLKDSVRFLKQIVQPEAIENNSPKPIKCFTRRVAYATSLKYLILHKKASPISGSMAKSMCSLKRF